MTRLQVFDPPMCCSTGVCGPSVDATLPRFAADLAWVESQGVTVERFNLAQQPQAFADSELVRRELSAHGSACLPLVLVDGVAVRRGEYPSRRELAAWTGVPLAASDEELPVLGWGCCEKPADGQGSATGCC